MDVVVDPGSIPLIELGDPGQHCHVVPEVILLLLVVRVDFEHVLNNID